MPYMEHLGMRMLSAVSNYLQHLQFRGKRSLHCWRWGHSVAVEHQFQCPWFSQCFSHFFLKPDSDYQWLMMFRNKHFHDFPMFSISSIIFHDFPMVFPCFSHVSHDFCSSPRLGSAFDLGKQANHHVVGDISRDHRGCFIHLYSDAVNIFWGTCFIHIVSSCFMHNL